MKILVLTTAREDAVQSALEAAGFLMNPAAQAFHLKLIETLSIQNDLSIASLLPKGAKRDTLKQNTFHYLNYPKSLLFKPFRSFILWRQIKALHLPQPDLIIYDSLNVSLAGCSKICRDKFSCPRVAILTDDPRNLTGVPHLYKQKVLSLSKKAEATLSVASNLNIVFTKNRAKCLVFEGLIRENIAKPIPSSCGDFIFFGGALYERYGVKTLIEAYLRSEIKTPLVVAGHGPLKEEIEALASKDSRLIFLGKISQNEYTKLTNQACLLINPRPYDKDLDPLCIPSKMIEYLASGKPIVSLVSTRLKELFPNDVEWILPGEKDGLDSFFSAHCDDQGKLINLKENKAKEKALSLYGQSHLADKIQSFLTEIKTCSK